MAFYSQGKEFLNLPEQVQKNLTDIADLKTKESKNESSVAYALGRIIVLEQKETTINTNIATADGKITTGTLDVEKDATFGSNVEVDGGMTLNSPSDLHFKTGDTDYTDFNTFKALFWDNIGKRRYQGMNIVWYEQEGGSEIIDPFAPYYTDISHYFAYASFVAQDLIYLPPVIFPDFPSATRAIAFLEGTKNNDVTLGNIPSNVIADRFAFYNKNIKYLRIGEDKVFRPSSLQNAFSYDTSLIGLTGSGSIDLSGCYSLAGCFIGCSSLKSLSACKHFPVSFDISASTAFEQSDLVEIISNLDSVSSAQTLTMGSTNLAKLTQDQILVATGKGWTLA